MTENTEQRLALALNPEPWTAPSISIGRRGGKPYPQVYKNEGLRAYQHAVKESLVGTEVWIDGEVDVQFFFWRQLPDYTTDAHVRARKHHADATNMQKALEDALQGVLFTNDREVRHIESWVMAQDKDTEPLIGIVIRPCGSLPNVDFRDLIMGDRQPVDRSHFDATDGLF